MGETTEIAWCDHTYNPWWGCQRVSQGCEHCYAEAFSKRVGLKVWGPTSERRFFGEKHWREPITWNAKAIAAGVRRRVFCSSMADVFEDREDLVAPRGHLFALIEATPNLDWLLLTKRPQNMVPLASHAWPDKWPANVWAGCTAESQEWADKRLPFLEQVPCRTKFVSCEPQIERVSFRPFLPFLDWIIVGGESGPKARPFDYSWARDILFQCRTGHAAFFMKQVGARPMAGGNLLKLGHPKGGALDEIPNDLRIRELPTSPASL